MSRGIVLWPDASTGAAVRSIWRELEAAGLPSLETHTHRLHQPHVSLVVADHLEAEAAAAAVGRLPEVQIPCRVEAAAFFPGGFLILPLVPNVELLHEQQRVSVSTGDLAVGRWEHTQPGKWSPHITCAYALTPDQAGAALAIAIRHLPPAGYLTTGGVEDGTTGENWPIPTGP
jgi:2'-5' RNA ligase superfamily